METPFALPSPARCPHPLGSGLRFHLGVIAALAALAIAAGCGKRQAAGPATSSSNRPPAANRDPAALVHTLRRTYQEAKSYADRARIRMTLVGADASVEQEIAVELAFQRPDHLRLKVAQGENEILVAAEGQRVMAAVIDTASENFDGQMVEYRAPQKVRVEDLYRATECLDPQTPGELASLLLSLPVRLDATPLGLLLDEPLWLDWSRSDGLILLEDEQLDGAPCYRLQVTSPDGPLTYWIDQKSQLISRIDLPPQILAGEGDSASRVELRMEFLEHRHNTQLALDPADRWIPPRDKRLRHFVLPPLERMAPLIGQRVEPYHFTTLEGQSETSEELSRDFQVLVWFQDDTASRLVLPELQRVFEQFKGRERVAFRAVCTEPATRMSHSQVQALAREEGLTMPVVRDLKAVGRDVFGIQQAPTLVVLDPHRTVHMVQVGGRPDLAAVLAMLLHQLLAGQDVAQQTRQRLEMVEDVYRRHLAAASLDAPPETTAAAAARGPAPASDPETVRLETLWTLTDLPEPGNLLIVEDGSDSRIVCVHGWREVVELDWDGNIRSRKSLALDQEDAVTFVRTATDGQGRRYYAATARMGGACYVFDSNWELVLRYPDAQQRHPGIADVLLDDLDQDGKLELYVGFQGIVGLHRVDWEGESQWRNRRLANVLSIARSIAPGAGALLVTSDQGTIVTVAADGTDHTPHVLAGLAVHQVASSGRHTPPAEQAVYCGLAYTLAGQFRALGLDSTLQPVWEHQLPAGAYRSQILFPTAAALGPRQQTYWLLAGPDGSIALVDAAGALRDQWTTGVDLVGLAASRQNDKDVIVVASPGRVEAIQVSGLP